MRSLFLSLLVLTLTLTGCSDKSEKEQPQTQTEKKVLNLYCWSNYFSPTVIQRFEEKNGVKVVQSFFSSNEELLAKLQAGARGYDLIVPTSYMIKPLKELGLIQPIQAKDWAEIKSLQKRFQNKQYDPNHEYAVPYAWGTTGLAVNRKKIKGKVDSWSWLFDHPELKGQLTMLDDAPSVVGAALKYLGYSYNESSDEAFAKVKELMAKQKTQLKSFTPESQPVLESGEFAISQAYSGDVIQVQKRTGADIEYVLPKEGGEIFIDNFAIPVGAPSPELAKLFIKHTLLSESAQTQVNHLFFSPVVEIASEPSMKELKNISAVFPTESALSKFEVMKEDDARIEKIQKLWTEIKSL